MNVCFVSSYPPNRGRLSEYAKSLVKEIAKMPHIDSIIVVGDTVGGLKNLIFESDKVLVLRVWHPDNPLSILKILPTVVRLRPHIVHFNVHFQSFGRKRLSNFVGLSLIFFSRLLGLKVVASVHNFGELVDLSKVQLKPTVLNRVGILLATKFVLFANRVVVKVKFYKKYLMERYRCVNISYVPHGSALNVDPPSNKNEKIVLAFGHWAPHKGLPVLFDAIEEVSKVMSNVKFVVGGSAHPNFPRYLEKFKNMLNVDFVGYVKENEIARLFEEVDLVVLPYLTNTGTSGVFHLACSFGKPIIASDTIEIRELLKEGASAVLVPPGDSAALKDAIISVLSDERLMASMGKQNLLFAEREPWSLVAEEYEKLYLSALKS
ncbi:MAG: glycosyltransferase [Candidatus Bathyarchaeia archaeon]